MLSKSEDTKKQQLLYILESKENRVRKNAKRGIEGKGYRILCGYRSQRRGVDPVIPNKERKELCIALSTSILQDTIVSETYLLCGG